jgi:excisionase family DNA binding protein
LLGLAGRRFNSRLSNRGANAAGKLIARIMLRPVKMQAKKSKAVTRMKASTSNGTVTKGGNNGAVKSPNGATDQILTVPMLAEYLLCHPSTIYRLLKNKRIPGFRVGSDWRFRRSAIDQWLNKATIPSGR